jgi:hypothetical protein
MAKKNKNKNRIKDVIGPLSPKQVRRETKARVRLEFGDVGRALRGDLRASRQNSRNIQSWYGEYQNQMNKLRAGQAANTQTLQNQMNQNASYLGGQGSARSSAVADDQGRSAAIRGAMTDQGAGATENAAEGQRQALLASSRDRAAQMGYSSNSRLAGVNSAAELGRQADQRQERNTRLETRAKMRDLARDKGASRIKNRADITRQERDFYISRRTLNSNIRSDKEQRALDRQRENRIASGGGSGGGSGSGGKGSSGYSVGEAMSLVTAQVAKSGGSWTEVRKNPGIAVAALVDRGVSKPVAKKAVRRWIKRRQQKAVENATSPWYG